MPWPVTNGRTESLHVKIEPMESREGELTLTINSAARFHCAPDWSWDTSATPLADRDLWVVLSGRGTLVSGENHADARGAAAEPYEIGRGDAFVLGGRRPVRATHDPSDPLTVVAVHFSGEDNLPFHARITPIEFLAGVLDRLLRCRLRGDTRAAHRLLGVALDEVRLAAAAPASGRDAVRDLADRIRERPGDAWSVGEMAEAASVSPQYLGRLFREQTGRSPKEYILETRMEAARAYLRGSSLPMKRIAAELGFHDEFHFSRSFRVRLGFSPSLYRSGGPG